MLEELHTVYPILVTIPARFEGVEENTRAHAGLHALSAFLVSAIEAKGYKATMAHGGIGHDVVLAIRKSDA